jgi:hypothetical protein
MGLIKKPTANLRQWAFSFLQFQTATNYPPSPPVAGDLSLVMRQQQTAPASGPPTFIISISAILLIIFGDIVSTFSLALSRKIVSTNAAQVVVEYPLKEESMAAKRNGKDRLEEAIAVVLQTQAVLSQNLALTNQRMDERFARQDERLERIETVLTQLIHLVQELPEAVKDKIGFRPE